MRSVQKTQQKRRYSLRALFIALALFVGVGIFAVHTVNTYAADDEVIVGTIGSGACGNLGQSLGELTVDSNGAVYILDGPSYLVCRLAPNLNNASVFAGSTQGYADGTGAAAQFRSLRDITSDSAGNLFVLDEYRIRKITPSGVVTTFAGSSQGYTDSVGVAAQFQNPDSMTIDSAGNLYVKDGTSIRKITPTGSVTTVLTGIPGGSLTRDASGNFYVAANGQVKKITPSGVVTTLAGSTLGYADGTGTAAQFEFIRGIVSDPAGTIYALDRNRLRKITPDGTVTTLAGYSNEGVSIDGPGSEASFEVPTGITVDSKGNLYISEHSSASYIRKVTLPQVTQPPTEGPETPTIPGVPNTGRI